MTTGLQKVTNFLVPATSSTNAFMIRETFSATPVYRSFNNVQLDGLPFRPSGVIIDNTAGAGDLTVLINELSYSIVCAAGSTLQMPYPAPINHSVNITGDGEATVVFVDYPVIPFSGSSSGGGGGTIPNPLPITGALTDTELRASPIDVVSSQNRRAFYAVEVSGTTPQRLQPTVIDPLKTYVLKSLRVLIGPMTSPGSADTLTCGATIPASVSVSGALETIFHRSGAVPSAISFGLATAQVLLYENTNMHVVIPTPTISDFPTFVSEYGDGNMMVEYELEIH